MLGGIKITDFQTSMEILLIWWSSCCSPSLIYFWWPIHYVSFFSHVNCRGIGSTNQIKWIKYMFLFPNLLRKCIGPTTAAGRVLTMNYKLWQSLLQKVSQPSQVILPLLAGSESSRLSTLYSIKKTKHTNANLQQVLIRCRDHVDEVKQFQSGLPASCSKTAWMSKWSQC